MHRSRFVIALAAAAWLAVLPARSHARGLTEPVVPAKLVVPAGNKLFRIGHAVGTQNYVCVSTVKGYAWIAYGPQATLFDDAGAQLSTHFLSANPDEGDTFRPTWQHSRDTSTVWARPIETSSDPAFVEAGAIPWLLLQTAGVSVGPNRGRRLADTTFIQRVHTSGGVAPTEGCDDADDIGAKQLVPYATDYYFYKARGRAK